VAHATGDEVAKAVDNIKTTESEEAAVYSARLE